MSALLQTPDRTPDLAEGRRFCSMIVGHDVAAKLTFQTFDDNKERRDGRLTRTLRGTFDECAAELVSLGARGAGVFVTINQADDSGRRKKENITAVRAVFADFDGVPLKNKDRLALTPHAIVESSPDKWHVYYLTLGVPLDRFESIQAALAETFQSDPAMADRARVMRLPGFFHQKDPGRPFMTRIVSGEPDGRPYGLSDLPRAALANEPSPRSADVITLPGTEQLARAVELGRAAAQRSHAEPTETRHSIAVCLGWDCKRERLSEDAYKLAARTFANECRSENVEGAHEPYTEKRALDDVLHALKSSKEPGPPAKKVPVSQVDQLVRIARSAEIWRIDQTTYYATVRINGRVEHMPTSGQDFRRWLTREYIVNMKGRSPGSQAVADAVKSIEAISTDAPIYQTARRVGEHNGKLYVDICDLERRAIEIDEIGWRIVSQPPVRFIRSAGMLPLPLPMTGGSIEELRPFINAGDASFRLLVATMLAYLRPKGPFPILAVHGEHGTAKSTTSRFVMGLIDPHQAALRRPPREDRDLVTAANASWLLAFDNLSSVPQWMSDSFCVLSTSGSYTARAMRTDYDEVILSNLCRPLLLNGINDIDQYPDLTSRTIRVVLEPIPEEARKTQASIDEAFEAARPRLLGALYTAIACAMRRLPTTKLDRLPRLADFATWATAAEEGLGWRAGTFMAAFEANQEASVLDGLSGDTVAQALIGFVRDRKAPPSADRPCWEGALSDLFNDLGNFVDEETRRGKFWPPIARSLAQRLRKLAPGLRVAGINVDMTRKDTTRNVQLVLIYQIGELGIDGLTGGGAIRSAPAPEDEHYFRGGRAF